MTTVRAFERSTDCWDRPIQAEAIDQRARRNDRLVVAGFAIDPQIKGLGDKAAEGFWLGSGVV